METLETLINDPLLIKINEIIDTLDPDNDGITTFDILQAIDKQYGLSKEEYRNMDNKILYRINKTQQKLLEKFEEFKQTEQYARIRREVVAFIDPTKIIDNNDYYGIINSGIYTEQELDDILLEQKIFDQYISKLEREYGLNLLLPNSHNYWIKPRLVDIDQYGYKLFKRHVRGLNTIGHKVYDNGKYLLEQPDKKKLQYHTESLLELIKPQQEDLDDQ